MHELLRHCFRVSVLCALLSVSPVSAQPVYNVRMTHAPFSEDVLDLRGWPVKSLLTAKDMLERVRILSFSNSPDNNSLAVVVLAMDTTANVYRSSLNIVDRNGNIVRVLGSAGPPRWGFGGEYRQAPSPIWLDGQHVCHILPIANIWQVRCWNTTTGDVSFSSNGNADVLGYWLTKSSQLVVARRANPDRNTFSNSPPPPYVHTPTTTITTFDGSHVEPSRETKPELKFAQIDPSSGRENALDGDNSVESLLAMPLSLALRGAPYAELRGPNGLSASLSQTTPAKWRMANGSELILTADSRRGTKTLTDSFAYIVGWTKSNELIVVSSLRFGSSALLAMSLESEIKVRQLAEVEGYLAACRLGPTGEEVSCKHDAPNRLEHLARIALTNGSIDEFFNPNPKLDAAIRLRKPVLRKFVNSLGDEAHAFVLGAVPGKRKPLLISIYWFHGGFFEQLGEEVPLYELADTGFVVVGLHMPRFRDRTLGFDWAVQDWESPRRMMEEIRNTLDREATIDPRKVGVSGISYGAELIGYSISKSHMFAAAASGHGAIDPTWMLTMPEFGEKGYGFPGRWWESASSMARWKAFAPALNAKSICTPLLIQTGEGESIFAIPLVKELRRFSRPFELILYPNEYHLKMAPSNKLAISTLNTTWLRFWLDDGFDPAKADAQLMSRWLPLREKQKSCGGKEAGAPYRR
jgi:dipeptidyl aminopeptidase/acylaminoacyl peptidase